MYAEALYSHKDKKNKENTNTIRLNSTLYFHIRDISMTMHFLSLSRRRYKRQTFFSFSIHFRLPHPSHILNCDYGIR